MFADYNFRHYNYRLIIYALVLSILGILVIGSATGRESQAMNKQILGVAVSFGIAMVVSMVDYHRYERLIPLVYIACIVVLLAVLVVGSTTKGATRWLRIGGENGYKLQPSEFVKIGLILAGAWFLSFRQEKLDRMVTVLLYGLLCAVPLVMIFMQPNLSTTIVITFSLVCMIFAAGLSWKYIAGILAVGIPSIALTLYLALQNMVPFLQAYQVNRIMARFFNSDNQYVDLNRQQNNSIMAIGSGQLKGKGLFNNTLSSVKNGNFLSEEQTDFIFAIIGEELGFIGSMFTILLFALLVGECLLIASRARDMMGRLIASGMAALLAFQSFANIAVATGIFPNTGLPLPFISSGISSLLSMFIGIGLVMNVGLQRREKKDD